MKSKTVLNSVGLRLELGCAVLIMVTFETWTELALKRMPAFSVSISPYSSLLTSA